MERHTVLDLFCGCGGLSFGFSQAGFNIKYALDIWDKALDTFKVNHPSAIVINKKIEDVSTNVIKDRSIDIVVGGPPCQGFSIAGKRDINDVRNSLYQSFFRFVEQFSPKFFVMENVPNLVSIGKGKVLNSIIDCSERLGYYTSWQVLKASDYGVPQNRKRVFIIGSKFTSFDFSILSSKSFPLVTSEEAISDLPENDIDAKDGYPEPSKSEYQKMMRKRSNGIYNHITTKHTEKTKKIISLVPDGGNYKNLPENLKGTRKVNIAWTRLNSKKPSFTIDTGHRHHFHYKYNRVPTVREAARIQSFPDRFIFLGSKSDQEKQVGNAVPPLLAKVIALEIKNMME